MKYTVSSETELKKILTLVEDFPKSFKEQIELIENKNSIIYIHLQTRSFEELPKYFIPENAYEVFFDTGFIKLEFSGVIIMIQNSKNRFKLNTIKNFKI